MPAYVLISSPTLEEGRGSREVRFEARNDAEAIDYARNAPDDLLVSSPVHIAVRTADNYPLWSTGRSGFSWAA